MHGEGDSFRFDARFRVVDTCFESEGIFDKMHDLVETPLEGSHDVFVRDESPSLSFDDSVCAILLIIPMFHLCIYNPLLPLSMTLLSPLIIL